MTTKDNKRVMIFIDGSNLFYSMRSSGSDYRLDYIKLIEKLVDGRDHIRTYYYASSKVPPISKQTAFYDALQRMGIRTTIKPLKYGKEKGVDVALVTDLIQLAFGKTMDVAIVLSGDQDFVDAIQVVQRLGITVEVAAFRGHFAEDLKKNTDRVIFLDDIKDDISLNYTAQG